jgi:hypothetical protein
VASPWSRALESLKGLARVEPRSVVALCVIVASMAFFGWVVHQHYPIEDWLFWRYAVYWVSTATWLAGVLGVGHLVVSRTFGLRLPTHEATVAALGVGLLGFESSSRAGEGSSFTRGLASVSSASRASRSAVSCSR